MPAFCSVASCADRYGHFEKVSYHRFPLKRKELVEQWVIFAERGKTWKPNRYSAICARHFNDSDYNHNDRKKKLRKTAVPSIKLLKLDKKENFNLVANSASPKLTTVASVHPASVINPVSHVKRSLNKTVFASPASIAHAVPHVKRSAKLMAYHKAREKCPTDGSETSSECDTTASYDGGDTEDEYETETLKKQVKIPLKSYCRFCGKLTISMTTFGGNFEIFGMVQKCLPTLNIQQNDHLPKEICPYCYDSLKKFSEFIDHVLEAQSDLQRRYKTEKFDKKVEKQFKIKQEPMVRVKQEIPEATQVARSNEMDEEACDQDNDQNDIDQKFPFDDFPILTAQDGVNDADIMEIINLDDPFISIPDDDANNTSDSCSENCEKEEQRPDCLLEKPAYYAETFQNNECTKNTRTNSTEQNDSSNHLCGPNDSNDHCEHNDTCEQNDLNAQNTDSHYDPKNDAYENTESPENEESQDHHDIPMNETYRKSREGDSAKVKKSLVANVYLLLKDHNYASVPKENFKQEFHLNSSSYKTEKSEGSDIKNVGEAVPHFVHTIESKCEKKQRLEIEEKTGKERRSSKSVVTVVSSLTIPSQPLSFPLPVKTPPTKPNIVVLNDERIAEPSEAFQFQTCSVCFMKFFSVESLNQHFAMTHKVAPKELPNENETENDNDHENYEMAHDNPDDYKESQQYEEDESSKENISMNMEEQSHGDISNDAYENNESLASEQDMETDKYFPEEYVLEQTIVTSSENAYQPSSDPGGNIHSEEAHLYQEEAQSKDHYIPNPNDNENDNHLENENSTLYNNVENFTFLQPAPYTQHHMQEQNYQPHENTQQNIYTYQSSPHGITHALPILSPQDSLSVQSGHLGSQISYVNEGIHYQKAPKQKIFINDVNILNVQQGFAHPNNQTMIAPVQVQTVKYDYESVRSAESQYQCSSQYSCASEAYKQDFVYGKASYEQWPESSCSSVTTRNSHSQTPLAMRKRPCSNTKTLKKIALQYKKLRGLCLRVFRRCEVLQKRQSSQSTRRERAPAKKPKRKTHCCKVCQKRFLSFLELLKHKQTSKDHWIKKPMHFAAKCPGCFKFFNNSRAYNNHQKFVCLSISLKYFTKRLHTYKCKYCSLRGFPHWRIYCRHIAKCKILKKTQILQKKKKLLERKRRVKKIIPNVSTTMPSVSSTTVALASSSTFSNTEYFVKCFKCCYCFKDKKHYKEHLEFCPGQTHYNPRKRSYNCALVFK